MKTANYIWEGVQGMFGGEMAAQVVRAVVIVVMGLVLAKVSGGVARRMASRRMTAHHVILFQRGVSYLVIGVFFVATLRQLGFNLGVVLGAAGVLSVAVGFASQASMSNLISGLFLIGENPFSVGDIIKVDETTGEVLSIDLLAVKLRTFDNLYVRIPNETILKSAVTTLTKFPIRRVDLQIGVAYREDIGRVREVLSEVAGRNVLCLEEPKPLFIVKGFGDSSVDIQFSVWVQRENFLDLKNGIQEEIKQAFDDEGIEIPFPHRSLYAGSMTDPFPVRVVKDGPDGGTADGQVGPGGRPTVG